MSLTKTHKTRKEPLKKIHKQSVHRYQPIAILSRDLTHEGILLEQHIREGRFQRSLALISSLIAGLEVTYEHYRGSYGQRIMYTPVILSFTLLVTSIWSIFSRWVARIVLPIASLLLLVDGSLGFFYHVRGISRKPGGWHIPITNLIMGPPIFAPPLLGICGFLGLITTFLRREEDFKKPSLSPPVHSLPASRGWLLRHLTREGIVFEQDVREGRFQRVLAAATAVSAFFSGIEALYSHYKNNFTYRVQWSPILLTPMLMIAGFGAVWSRTLARTLLPITSLLALANGGIGFLYHLRGVMRRLGGLHRNPLYNIIYGPPMFAPLLFAASGFLGLLASCLRRADQP